MSFSRSVFCAVAVMCLLTSGCGSDTPTTPSPGGGGGNGGSGGTVIDVTGNERIGWDQQAASAAALGGLGYAAYVDNVPSDLSGVSCASTAGASGFACSAPLPRMTPGVHSIQLTSFLTQGRVESARSAAIQVRLGTGIMPGATLTDATSGATTLDGVALRADLLANGLEDPTDLVISPDGRIFVAERGGRIKLFRDGQLVPTPALSLPDVTTGEGGGLLSIALDPAFEETRRLYAVYTAEAGFRLARFRLVGDTLGERAVILDGVSAGAPARAAIRFGSDGRLYLALDDAGNAWLAGDLGSYNGKVLRLNHDGTTPPDQAGGTPVFATELNHPAGLAWSRTGGTLWAADVDPDGFERLQAAAPAAPGQRAVVASRYTLPNGLGASGMAFYGADTVPAFQGNLFVAASQADAILRVRFEHPESRTITATEWMFRGRLGSPRAIGVGPDGRIYVCTADALLQIAPE